MYRLLAWGVLCSFASSIVSAQTVGTPPHRAVEAVALDQPLQLDGFLDESVYARVEPVGDFVQQEPHEGEPSTEKTEVWVLFDDRNFYVSARMWDSHPERMVVNEMRRDAAPEIFLNENFSIVIDTFNDHRSGYYFTTNPLGAMRDAQFAGEGQINPDWNTIWISRGHRFESGWTLEIAIPFKSIRYPTEGEQQWNINFRRVVRWKNELAYFAMVPATTGPGGLTRVQSAAQLIGLQAPKASRNIEIKPYATARVTTDRTISPATSNDFDPGAGADLKYSITSGLTADFSYNTDFAQVEDDLQQVNLTRFGLFFPEKREFFLEGQSIFDFAGRSGGSRDIPTLFFSRRIGLENGYPVPILGGGRLTGKAGKYSLGFLDIQTRESEAASVPSTNFAAARVRRDILGSSYVGVLMTQRTPSGGVNNTLGAADAAFTFGRTGITTVNLYYARTYTRGRTDPAASYTASYEYSADRYGARAQYLAVDPGFSPEMGFLRREDFRQTLASFRFSPRPARITAVRKFLYEAGVERVTNSAGVLETRVLSASAGAEFHRGDVVSLSVERDYEFLHVPFPIAPPVTVPAGGYSFTRAAASYEIPASSRIRGTVSANAGSFYGGDRVEAKYGGRLAVMEQLSVEPTIDLNWIDLPGGRVRTRLVSARTTFTFSTRSALGALIQYNSSNHVLASNIRFRWEYVPGSDIFVVYSEGRDRLTLEPRVGALQNRAFIVKVTHLLRY